MRQVPFVGLRCCLLLATAMPSSSSAQIGCPPVTVVGDGCDYIDGGTPSLDVLGDQSLVPGTVTLVASNIRGLGFVHLAFGTAATPFTVGGCDLWVVPTLLTSQLMPGPTGEVSITPPNSVVLSPISVFAQVVAPEDPGGTSIASSRALQIDFGSECVNLGHLVDLFFSDNPVDVDLARKLLLDRGYDAVEALIQRAQIQSPAEPYAGKPLFHFTSNTPPFVLADGGDGLRADSKTATAMFTVDAIVTGKAIPYKYPVPYGDAPQGLTVDEHLSAIYMSWFTAHNASQTLSELQEAPPPLEGTSLSWPSGLLPTEEEANQTLEGLMTNGFSGIQIGLAGPVTPRPQPLAPVAPSSGSGAVYNNPDGSPSGSYNCLAHSVGLTDRWMHPFDVGEGFLGTGGNPNLLVTEPSCMEDIMGEQGFTEGEAPPGSSHTEVKTFHVPLPQPAAAPPLKEGFTHAISRDVPNFGPVSPWASKNGENQLFLIFGPYEDFLDFFGYNTGPFGQVRCWFKPN